MRIDYRWGGSDPERIRSYAIELVGLKPDVMLVSTAQVLQPLRQETGSIPIVFTQLSDPVQNGFVASLAHPGGNITGFSTFEASIWGSRAPGCACGRDSESGPGTSGGNAARR